MKNKCLFPEIAFIAKLLPTLEHLVKDAHEAKKLNLATTAGRRVKHSEREKARQTPKATQSSGGG